MARTETAAQRNRRLLAQAVARGVAARPVGSAYAVTSGTKAAVVYYPVSAGSCPCEWGRRQSALPRDARTLCGHQLVAAKAAQDRKAAERPQPTPPAGAVACAGGCGKVGRPLQDKPLAGPVLCPACTRAKEAAAPAAA